MPDTIEDRLAQLGTSLEDLTGIGSPALIRGRGEHLRVAHRRRVALTAATAAVVIIGAGSVVALRPSGHQPAPVSPGSPDSSASAPRVTGAPVAPASPASATTAVTVDLKQHKMTVAKNGKAVRTILVSAGKPGYPTATGSFTVADKLESDKLYSPPTPSGTYNATVQWVVKLDGNGPEMYAAPWSHGNFGKVDTSHGGIEMSDDDAQWLYANVKPGDHVQIQ